MKRHLAMALVLAAAGPALADPSVAPDCRVVHHHADGSTTTTPARSAGGKGRGASANSESHASGSRSASSSVSASSRSGLGGRSVASSAAQSSDGQARTITETRDDNGCTITIDDRASRGANP